MKSERKERDLIETLHCNKAILSQFNWPPMAKPGDCTLCLKEKEEKPKSGLFPCLGCGESFCVKHVAIHRESLKASLDTYDDLRSLSEYMMKETDDDQYARPFLEKIDAWMTETVEKVHLIAQEARQSVLDQFKQ